MIDDGALCRSGAGSSGHYRYCHGCLDGGWLRAAAAKICLSDQGRDTGAIFAQLRYFYRRGPVVGKTYWTLFQGPATNMASSCPGQGGMVTATTETVSSVAALN